jgi:hypothetical protein
MVMVMAIFWSHRLMLQEFINWQAERAITPRSLCKLASQQDFIVANARKASLNG